MSLGPGDALIHWRRRLMPWLMALVRLGAGWLVCRSVLTVLLAPVSPLKDLTGPLTLNALAALLVLGMVGFAWPRSYLAGGALLALGLGAFEWLWERSGQPPGPLASSLGILAVLCVGEWLSRILRRRFP